MRKFAAAMDSKFDLNVVADKNANVMEDERVVVIVVAEVFVVVVVTEQLGW